MLSGLFLCDGSKTPEFFKPVLDEDQFRHWLQLSFTEPHHQETLAVEGDVPRWSRSANRERVRFKKEARCAGRKAAIGPDVGYQILSVGPRIKQLLTIPSPEGRRTPFRRYLELASRPGKWPDVDFFPSRVIGHVGHPVPVGRKLRKRLTCIGI